MWGWRSDLRNLYNKCPVLNILCSDNNCLSLKIINSNKYKLIFICVNEWICTRFNKIIICDVCSGNHQSSLCPPASHRSQHGQWRKWFGEDLPWLQRKVRNMNQISAVIWHSGHNLLFIVVFFCINHNKYTLNWKKAQNFLSFGIQKADPQISSRTVGDWYSKNNTKHVGRKELRV